MMPSYFQDRQIGSASPDLPSPGTLTPTTPTGSFAPRSNALSNRVTSVLSASYADLEIRDALEILDARHLPNTQETRRQLRLNVQQEVINCNGDIIRDFGQVAEQLKRIGKVIESLNQSCAEMRAHVSAAQKETGPLLDEATTLLEQKGQVETRKQILKAFQSHFILSEVETTILSSTAELVNDEFFHKLARAKKIHQDCRVLLGTENERLGLEILEQSSKQLNAAFHKLYRWVQREFQTLDLENPHISASIRKALRALAERPTLFQSCLDHFAEAREHILSDAFHAALTGANSFGDPLAPKPIEFYAHDPLRYVGDMLAWAHSATVSEMEALEVLFVAEGEEIAKGIKAGIESEPWARPEDGAEVFDGRKALNQLVNRDLNGVSRLLRQRIEQVIHSHDEPTIAYKLANLLAFYSTTLARLLGDDSIFIETLSTIKESAMRQFRATMRDHVAAVQGELAVAPDDLSPPEFLEEALEMLKALMQSYETSAGSEDMEAGFEGVLTEALDPFLQGCENLGRLLPRPAGIIFSVNCLLAVKDTLMSHRNLAKQRITQLNDAVSTQSAKLVDYQHQYFVHQSGIGPLLKAVSELDDDADSVSIRKSPAFSPAALESASQTLDDFLPSAFVDAAENIKLLRNANMAQDITTKAAEKFCEDFEYLEKRINDADQLFLSLENGDRHRGSDEDGASGGQDDRSELLLKEMFPRTSAEIRVLLI